MHTSTQINSAPIGKAMRHNVLPHRRRSYAAHPGADLSDDAGMLAFAKRWHPYGGGSGEDIRVEFGLSVVEFYRRVAALLGDDVLPMKLDAHEVLSIRGVCRRRTWLGE